MFMFLLMITSIFQLSFHKGICWSRLILKSVCAPGCYPISFSYSTGAVTGLLVLLNFILFLMLSSGRLSKSSRIVPPSPCADWQLWKLVKTLTNLVLTTQCWNSFRLMDSGLQHLTQNWTLLAKFGCFCHKDCEPLYVRELFKYLFCVCPLEVGNNILCGNVFIYLLLWRGTWTIPFKFCVLVEMSS